MKHEWFETNTTPLLFFIVLIIIIGGLLEILPLFTIKNTVETIPEIRPYTPLELLGRDIYQREGCYLCHSQMIRSLKDDWLRYGHYSLAAESKYDHPALWGSRRIGPDLARIGGKYSNNWHVQHFIAPQNTTPESRMPNYSWLKDQPLKYFDITERLRTLAKLGIPYSENQSEYNANVNNFNTNLAKLFDINRAKESLLEQAETGNYDGDRNNLTEMDALIAYLQMLGTLVDFNKYNNEDYFIKFR